MGNKVSPSSDSSSSIEDSYELTSKHNNTQLWCKQWKPNNIEKAKCAIYICHGLGEYSMVYDFLAKSWAQKYDALVFANDHMGHGRSAGEPRAYTDTLDIYVDDMNMHIDEVYSKLQQTQEDLPLLVFGHSMGGAISLLYSLRYPDKVSGLVLMGPLINYSRNTLENQIKYHLTKSVSFMVPKSLPVQPLAYSDCCTEPEMAQEFRQDPLRFQGWVKMGLAVALLRAVEEIQAGCERFGTPIFVGHGTADKLCCPIASEEFVKNVASKIKTIKLYNGGAHCLFHEFKSGIREQILKDITDWMDERLESLKRRS